MKRLIIALIVGALGGGIAGFATGIFVYPFWFLTDVANETLAPGVERTRVAAGDFIHVNKADPVHWGKGSVVVYREGHDRTVVHLQDDFQVGPGPRFHVYLVERTKVNSGDDFVASRKVDLGRLRAFQGSQIYPVPGNVDVSAFHSVVVWCKEFGVLISPASLTGRAAGMVSAPHDRTALAPVKPS